jgi:hypothetical protein
MQLALESGLPVKVSKGHVLVRCSDATAEYLTGDRPLILVEPLCACPQRPYPHELTVHANIRRETPGKYIVWAGRKSDPFFDEVVTFASDAMRWPWSLMLSQREEPSTERSVR